MQYSFKNSIYNKDIYILAKECLDSNLFVPGWTFEKIFQDYTDITSDASIEESDDFGDYLEKEEKHHIFVMYENDKPIACLVTPYIKLQNKINRSLVKEDYSSILDIVHDSFNLTGFFVKKEYRGKGLAFQLFDNMITELKIKNRNHYFIYNIGVKSSKSFFNKLKARYKNFTFLK